MLYLLFFLASHFAFMRGEAEELSTPNQTCHASLRTCGITQLDKSLSNDFTSLLQIGIHALGPMQAGNPSRIMISPSGAFERNGKEVILLGGNYVLKAQPYFPDLGVVQKNARSIAADVRNMSYNHPQKTVLPCVRLGVLLEGAMPEKSGGIDKLWSAKLDATVRAFAAEGVYVFLDIHQDALSTTNGGEGLPWWMGADLQSTATNGESYIVSPAHPLALVPLVDEIGSTLRQVLPEYPQIRTIEGDTDPWRAYSVGADMGNPAFMNIGNPNIRLNNNDLAWKNGVLTLTEQVHNFAYRWWRSPFSKEDRALLFDPYLTFVIHLCRVWENQSNVVGVELFNEPPIGGFPNVSKALRGRRNIFEFYGAVLRELTNVRPVINAPVAIEDVGGGIPGGGILTDLVSLVPLPKWAREQLSNWAGRGQLIMSFHYYPGPLTSVGLAEMVELAERQADELGLGAGVPIFLSEFLSESNQVNANRLKEAADFGCDAVTWWHYADTDYTQTDGWFKYLTREEPIDHDGNINPDAWEVYAQTVANGTSWGARITGSGHAQQHVLNLVGAEPDV